MKMSYQIAAGALFAALVVPGAAAAQQAAPQPLQQAYVTTDLNMRAGPGPQFPVISVIRAKEGVTIYGCTQSGAWCDVSWGSDRGWAYAQYLAYDIAGAPVVVTEVGTRVQVPTVTYQTTTYWDEHYRDRPFYSERQRFVVETDGSQGATAGGAVTGAVTGAVVGGPVGAVIGGVAGAVIGASIDPPERVRSYIVEKPAEPVLLQGEVVVGASLPEVVTLHPVPGYEYHYAVVNGQGVLVDPRTRVVVYIYR